MFGARVADCALLGTALTGRNLEERRGDTPPRIGLCRTSQWKFAAPRMRDAVENAARRASDAGAHVVERDLPSIFARAWEAHAIIQNYEAVRHLAWEWANHRDELSPRLAETLAAGETVSAHSYDAARRVAKAARLALQGVFADIDVLLTPSAEDIAPQDIEDTGAPTFNKLWTLLGVLASMFPGFSRRTACRWASRSSARRWAMRPPLRPPHGWNPRCGADPRKGVKPFHACCTAKTNLVGALPVGG